MLTHPMTVNYTAAGRGSGASLKLAESRQSLDLTPILRRLGVDLGVSSNLLRYGTRVDQAIQAAMRFLVTDHSFAFSVL